MSTRVDWRAAALLGALAGCGGCPGETAPAKERVKAAALEAWTFGELGDASRVTLPPPCQFRRPARAAALGRATRIGTDRTRLGALLAAQGAALPRWRADVSAWVTLEGHRTTPTRAPWPDGAVHVSATPAPLILQRSGGRLAVWQGGAAEPLTGSSGFAGLGLRCAGGWCAALGRASDGTTTLWLGGGAPSSWRRTGLDADLDGGRATALVAAPPTPTVAIERRDQVHLVRVSEDRPGEVTARLRAPYGALDVAAPTRARPALAAVRRASPHTPCDARHGGLDVEAEGRAPVRLRAATPATRAAIVRLDGADIVVWLAPSHCGGRPARVLASALHPATGAPIGPVTTVATASQFAVAGRGDRLDLHLVADQTLLWLEARCGAGTL